MRPLSLFVVAIAGLVALPALAQNPPPAGTPTRIRGTVEKLDGQMLTVKSRDGQSLSIELAANVKVAYLVKKSLADSFPAMISTSPFRSPSRSPSRPRAGAYAPPKQTVSPTPRPAWR